MTEAQWLVSKDPLEMLILLDPANARVWKKDTPDPTPSNRKLRLFACACCQATIHSKKDHGWEEFMLAVTQLEQAADIDPFVTTLLINKYFHPDWDTLTLARWAARDVPNAADLLRCIVGNPFRPVVLPKVKHCRKCGWDGKGPNKKYCDLPVTFDDKVPHLWDETCPWLTPTVLTLARAAYEETVGQRCGRCGGDGKKKMGAVPSRWTSCETCHGTGTTGAGLLDPDRLLVLRDALMEAGCPAEAKCPRNYGEGDGVGLPGWFIQERHYSCEACGRTGFVPYPIIAHLRENSPHVRGCWSLDLLLSKE